MNKYHKHQSKGLNSGHSGKATIEQVKCSTSGILHNPSKSKIVVRDTETGEVVKGKSKSIGISVNAKAHIVMMSAAELFVKGA